MSAAWREHLHSDGEGRMRISKHGSMLTDAVLISDENHMKSHSDDRSPEHFAILLGCLELLVMLGPWRTGILAMVFQLGELWPQMSTLEN